MTIAQFAPQSAAQSPARAGVPAPSAALQQEHQALERLYILRGQLDYVRAQLASARPNPTDLDYQAVLPRLERSYDHAVRNYEAVRTPRTAISGTEPRRSPPPDSSTAVIPRVLGGGLMVVLLAVMATTAVRRARRRTAAPPVSAERWQHVEQTVTEMALEVKQLQQNQRATETAWMQRMTARTSATTATDKPNPTADS